MRSTASSRTGAAHGPPSARARAAPWRGAHRRLKEVDPGERIRGPGQEQRRDRDARPVRHARRSRLGRAGPMEGVAEAHERGVPAGRLAIGPPDACRRQRRDAAAERVAADHDPGLVGDLRLECRDCLLRLALRQVERVGVVTAVAQGVDPGAHRRRRARRAVTEIDPHPSMMPGRISGGYERGCERSGSRTMRTEQVACCRTLRATLPRMSRARPVRPCVPMTMRSALQARAAASSSVAASPSRHSASASMPPRSKLVGHLASRALRGPADAVAASA